MNGEGIGFNPEELDTSPEKDISKELMEYTVELPKRATFNDMFELIEVVYGKDVAQEVKNEVAWQVQQFDDYEPSKSVFEFYTEQGMTQEDIEGWLPILFND